MRLGWTAAVTLLVATVPAWGQESPLPDLFSEVIDVRAVNVEVVVTDRRGNRIRGLEASDFELRVDRKPVPINYFVEIDDGYARSSIDDGIQAAASLATDEQVGTNHLIFIDDLQALRHHRNRVLRALERDLGLLSPVDRVAVVAFDGSSVSILLDWTNSGSRIIEALGKARGREAYGRPKQFDLGTRPDHIRRTVMAAATTIRSLADAPGRKVMLLLTQDWSRTNDFRANRASMENLYSPLVHTANRVGYSLYPIDLPGPRPKPRMVSSSYHDPVFGLYGPRFRPNYTGRYAFPSYETEEHDVLRYLARQTGARAMLNSYRDRALSETVADTRSYYWLGFEAPGTEEDQLHRIKVRLRGHRGLRVRNRKHYRDTSRDTELSMRLESSLLLGGSPGADTLEVRFGTARKTGLLAVTVPMQVTIPLDGVTLLPMDGLWMTELELRVAFLNRFGRLSMQPARKIPVVKIDEPVPGDVLVYETELRMRKPRHRYVAAVYEPISGAILSASGQLGPYRDTNVPTESLAESSQPTNCSPGQDVLEVCLGTPSKAGLGRVSVSMKVKIPLNDLTLLPIKALWTNELEFRVIVIDEQGARSRKPVRKIPIRGLRAPQPGDYFVYETDVRVGKRQDRYIAEVYDPLSGTTLSASGELGPHTRGNDPTEAAR